MLTVAALFVAFFLFCFSSAAPTDNTALPQLTGCWGTCAKTAGGANSCDWSDTECICKLANSTPYLADVISCARKSCGGVDSQGAADFLSPLQTSCAILKTSISQSRINAAHDVAAGDASPNAAPSSQTKPSKAATPTLPPMATAPPRSESENGSSKAKATSAAGAATTNGVVIAPSIPVLSFSPTESLPAYTAKSNPSSKSSNGDGGDGSLFGYQEDSGAGSLRIPGGSAVALLALGLSVGAAMIL